MLNSGPLDGVINDVIGQESIKSCKIWETKKGLRFTIFSVESNGRRNDFPQNKRVAFVVSKIAQE